VLLARLLPPWPVVSSVLWLTLALRLFVCLCVPLSSQSHYDFGLRALKSVLRSAGGLKRAAIQDMDPARKDEKKGDVKDEKGAAPPAPAPAPVPIAKPTTEKEWLTVEQALLVKSMCSTLVPKLISEDVALFSTLLTAVFPDASVTAPYVEALRKAMAVACKESFYTDETSWLDKCMQFYQIQNINHGVILVGPSGTGKTSAWRMLREGMQRVDGIKIVTYIIDPKALTKDELYGTLDPTTLEWTDGIFTSILRQIVGNVRNESSKRHWIIFDGDVDPEWAENLNRYGRTRLNAHVPS
jgi:dynein heavy chain 1, cytosolic